MGLKTKSGYAFNNPLGSVKCRSAISKLSAGISRSPFMALLRRICIRFIPARRGLSIEIYYKFLSPPSIRGG